ncbi:hypothetical protein D3C75_1072190 [compost metagenome]
MHLHGHLVQRCAVPQGFCLDIGLGIFRRCAEPGFEGLGVLGVGALQAHQPVQRLVHGTSTGIRPGR